MAEISIKFNKNHAEKKTPFFFGIFNYQNPQISAIFSYMSKVNLSPHVWGFFFTLLIYEKIV